MGPWSKRGHRDKGSAPRGTCVRVRVRVHVVCMTDFDISPWLHPQCTLVMGSSALVHWSHSHWCLIVRNARPAHAQTCVRVYINHAAATAINHFFYRWYCIARLVLISILCNEFRQ